MSLITNPPRGDLTGELPSPEADEPICCDIDQHQFHAIKCYYLALLLKQLGGDDFTDPAKIVEDFGPYRGYSEADLRVLIGDMVGSLLQNNGITIELPEAKSGAAFLKNTFNTFQLQAFEELLWDQIVVLLQNP